MIGVLAIVALITTAGAYIPEYSEEDLKRSYDFNPNPVTATFIKEDTKVTLRRKEDLSDHEITLYPDELANVRHAQLDACGKYHGISVGDDRDIFCKISYFNFEASHFDSDKRQGFRFTLFFESGFLGPLRLDIPVFQLPEDAFYYEEEQLKTWADENHVGLINPIGKEMEDVLNGKPIELQFDWLSRLLEHNIFEKPTPHQDQYKNYVTRPIVMPGYTINKFIDLIQYIEDADHIFDSF